GREERARLHRELAALRLGSPAQRSAAFEDFTALVTLEPEVESHRKALADLAAELDRQAPRTEILVRASQACSDTRLRASLLLEAADTMREHLDDVPRSIQLYQGIIDLEGVEPAFVLSTARKLEPLLAAARMPAEHCVVLERVAELETDAGSRREALGRVAHIASDQLGDHGRAARAWRA